ncbi:MAG: DUF4340 domain-containing protein [Gemmataceae bacterium]
MSFRTTAILFGIVFLLGVGLLVLSLSDEDTTPTKDLLLGKFAGAKAEEIDTVEIEKGSSHLVLKREGKDKWVIQEPVSARAEAAGVDRLVDSLLKVRATSYSELSSNAAVHGLDTPSLKVTLRSKDKSDTLNIGDVTIGGSKAVGFVTTPDRKRPMAVTRSDLEPLFKESKAGSAGDLAKWVNDYRVKQVFAVDSRSGTDDVNFIKLTSKGKELSLNKSPAGAWTFASPAGWGDAALTGDLSATNPAAVTGVRGLLNTVVNLQAAAADDFIDHVPDDKLKDYGLNADNPDLIRVEIKDKNGLAEAAILAKKAEAPATPPTPGTPLPPPAFKLYVKVGDSKTVVRVNPPATFDGLVAAIANPDPLRDRDLVKDSDKNRIDAIDLTVGGQVTKLRKVGGSFGRWQLFGGPNDPQDANTAVVAKLLDLVAKPGVVKDFPASSDANFTPAETRAEVKLWTDGIKPNTDAKADPKAEPKVDGPPIVLQFGKKDAEGIFVRRTLASGAKNDCRLPDKVKVGGAAPPPQSSPFDPPKPSTDEVVDVVAAVAKNRLDFLDTSLKGFSQLQANKIVIQNGANITEVVKDVPKEPTGEVKWKYVLPAPQKDRTADGGTVGDLISMLATESVVKFVSEAPAEADLVKWGLDPKAPKLKVTVGLDTGAVPPPTGEKKDKPDSERVYWFGNETDDKQHVYAKQDGKNGVFTVRKPVVEKFTNADLRDKTLVRFDRTKVKKLSFKGWKDKTGFEVELNFEKKDGNWAVTKSPGAYVVDPAKVDKFLDAANGLRAKAFVAGAAKPEQKLSPADGALQVFLEVEGAPLISFTVGAATDADASYFLQTSTLPANENIATVLIDAFKAYKDNSGAFAK